jgi:holo-[acyl-carrier protein] synthase
MGIIGIGIDICENRRIEKLINKFGDHFLKRIFHSDEILYGLEKYKDSQMMLYNFFTKRFAGKEAFTKALGFTKNIHKNEISIIPNKNGRPEIQIFDITKTEIQKHFPFNIAFHISLSDEKKFSIAQVIIEKL